MTIFLDFAKIKDAPDEFLQPQKLIELIEAAMEDELYFVLPNVDGSKMYLHAAFKDSYAALVAVLIQEGGAGKFVSDVGWGTYLGSVTTLLTLMVGEAHEQGRIIDEADLPFVEDLPAGTYEQGVPVQTPQLTDEDLENLKADFERWNEANPDSPF